MPSREDLLDDAKAYGSKGQNWHEDFVAYMVAMVTHPTFEDMPDAVNDDGKIQWEAPSNRRGGKFQDTHHKRRDWWRAKAESIGIDTTVDQWISSTAKRIHPTGEKPCKRCGRVLRIAYVYPNGRLMDRVTEAFGGRVEVDPLEQIVEIVRRVSDQIGKEHVSLFRTVLATSSIKPPDELCSLDDWISWLEDSYIPSEPPLLSPGAMSNAPDRFDGFHSFNLCCRKKADTGRHETNMRAYTTDRRVFEFWSEGDWVAADRLMGLVTARMRDEPCADGGLGPPTADHIGPLSLGFAHRPVFRLLSKTANSAKNNRMTLRDVVDLRAAEARGEKVISWYAKPLWDLRKDCVDSDELALRLSKQLRDNQRAAMYVLVELFASGFEVFLASLLGLHCADYNVEFCDLKSENYITQYSKLVRIGRNNKYVTEQKARRLRVGFAALHAYGTRENRHSSFLSHVLTERSAAEVMHAASCLNEAPKEVADLNQALRSALSMSDVRAAELRLRVLSASLPDVVEVPQFAEALGHLVLAMGEIGRSISGSWESERYVRTGFDDE